MRRLGLPVAAVGLIAIAVLAVLMIGQGHHAGGCDPFWPTPNRKNPLDFAFLKAHNQPTAGSLALDSSAVTARYRSRDPRNFAVEVSTGEYAVAFGLPLSDAQNPFYRDDPARRVIIIVSYGSFDWMMTGDFAAQPAPRSLPYHVGVGALDAQTGSVVRDQFPVCK